MTGKYALPVRLVAALALIAATTGCGNSLKSTLGLGKKAPDEYQVVENAPLVVPPDYTLRPPAPGAPRPQELDVRRQAEQILLGPSKRAGAQDDRLSPGELAFLNMAGANEADPGIRQLVNREGAVLASDDEGFVDRLMFWQSSPDRAVTIDPAAEAERLRRNADEGRPVSYGDTPVVIKKQKAPLEDLNPF